jgi:hypothetical protein
MNIKAEITSEHMIRTLLGDYGFDKLEITRFCKIDSDLINRVLRDEAALSNKVSSRLTKLYQRLTDIKAEIR